MRIDVHAHYFPVEYLDRFDRYGGNQATAFIRKAKMASADSSGLEANLRFARPESMLTRIFGRLSAWQNWIFIRPNAVGEAGALKVYGTGNKAKFKWERV